MMRANLRRQQGSAAIRKLFTSCFTTVRPVSRQVYGAYKYPRAQMHQLRPGAAVAQAGPMTPQTLTSPADGATRRVGPFEMKPQVALRCAASAIAGNCV